jgi:hypothetical protein
VPVRFTGGLPVEPAPEKLDLPVGFGKQDYWIGKPIFPGDIRGLPLMERKSFVLGTINALGAPNELEMPHAPDEVFASAVARRITATGIGSVEAALLECAEMDVAAQIEDLFPG